MIDWLNPSDDILEAERIGYDEGYDKGMSDALEHTESEAAKEIERLQKQVSALSDDRDNIVNRVRLALNLSEYTGRAIWEHAAEMKIELERLRIPLCIGLETIKTLAETGKADFTSHTSLVAASDLYQHYPFDEEREKEVEAALNHVSVVERDSKAMKLIRQGIVVELCEYSLLDNDGPQYRAMTLDCRKAWAADPADAVIAANEAPEYDGP